MTAANIKAKPLWHRALAWWLLLIGSALCATTYWPGLSGGFLFDDYPNIVDNKAVQPTSATLPSIINAALSSPSSDFKRPLSSLTFAVNYLITGLDPYWMKLTNLAIHLLNGLLVFLLTRELVSLTDTTSNANRQHPGIVAAFVACGWLLLPINLTAVLYVVQRMESLANLFVLIGLIGYVVGRRRMQLYASGQICAGARQGFVLCIASTSIPMAIGVLAKETAVMLPLYALLIEWTVFDFQKKAAKHLVIGTSSKCRDKRIEILFLGILALPIATGLAWLIPWLLKAATWATRDFTLGTRLLSETRIVFDYIIWTILPTPSNFSFYHDDFQISTSLFSPWTTLGSTIALTTLAALAVWIRRRRPLVSLGIALFIGCHLLTATILPLELVYEHRNYFSSFGVLLALMSLLLPEATQQTSGANSFALARYVLLGGLIFLWWSETVLSAKAWGNSLELAQTLADRASNSPRAEYELGRTYIIYSTYNPSSPFTRLAYAPLERAAAIPGSSILPEQALIFMNSRMQLPINDAWWDSIISKLKTRPPGVQDESSLAALTDCAHNQQCNLPKDRLEQAYLAATSHPNPSARLLAMYSGFEWNINQNHNLGLQLAEQAVLRAPNEPAYRITLIRMLIDSNRRDQAMIQIESLKRLNIGGRLDEDLMKLPH